MVRATAAAVADAATTRAAASRLPKAGACCSGLGRARLVVVAVVAVLVAVVIYGKMQQRGIDETPAPRGASAADEPVRGDATDSGVETELPEGVLAMVNGQAITTEYFDAQLAKAPEKALAMLTADKPRFLDELIARALMAQEAKRLKLEESEPYRKGMAQAGEDGEAEEKVLITVLLHERAMKGLSVSDTELKSFYDANKDRLKGNTFEEIQDQLREFLMQRKPACGD